MSATYKDIKIKSILSQNLSGRLNSLLLQLYY